MIPILILSALIIAVYLIARSEAFREDRKIDAGMGGPDLNHDSLVARRVIILSLLVLGLWCLAIAVTERNLLRDVLMFVCFAACAWATFVPAHRFHLNKLRGFDFRYIAPWGNKTDRMYYSISMLGMWIVMMVGARKYLSPLIYWPDEIELQDDRKTYHLKSPMYGTRKQVHRAGLLAYIAEGVVLCVAVLLFLHLVCSGVGDPASAVTLSAVVLGEDASGLLAPIVVATPGS